MTKSRPGPSATHPRMRSATEPPVSMAETRSSPSAAAAASAPRPIRSTFQCSQDWSAIERSVRSCRAPASPIKTMPRTPTGATRCSATARWPLSATRCARCLTRQVAYRGAAPSRRFTVAHWSRTCRPYCRVVRAASTPNRAIARCELPSVSTLRAMGSSERGSRSNIDGPPGAGAGATAAAGAPGATGIAGRGDFNAATSARKASTRASRTSSVVGEPSTAVSIATGSR